MDSGEYLCVASSGSTTVTDPPIYVTILPGAFIRTIVNQWSRKESHVVGPMVQDVGVVLMIDVFTMYYSGKFW